MSSLSALFRLPSVSFIERVDTADTRNAFICSWSGRRKSNLFDTFLLSYRYVKLVLEHTSLSITCLSSTLLQKLEVLNLITDLPSTRHFCCELGDSRLRNGFTLCIIRFIIQKNLLSTFRKVFLCFVRNSEQVTIISLYLNEFCNRDGVCLLRGSNCTFIQN